MIDDINKLNKIGDIINSEGSILALYKDGNKYYLSSLLNDHSGLLYYSINKEDLREYLNSAIRLNDLYLKSDDFIVKRKFRTKEDSFIKSDMLHHILFGDRYFKDIPESMRNENLDIQ
jgi:hypothetical protein